MKKMVVAVILMCFALIFGLWAWNVAEQRDFDVIFAASGEKAIQWAERAKTDKWVEVVKLELLNGKLTYVPLTKEEIDKQNLSDSTIMVRRWLPGDEGSETLNTLDKIGYSGAGELARNKSEKAATKKRKVFWLSSISVLLGITSIVFLFLRFRSPTRGDFDTRYCPECGTEMEDSTSKFCINCGKALTKEENMRED